MSSATVSCARCHYYRSGPDDPLCKGCPGDGSKPAAPPPLPALRDIFLPEDPSTGAYAESLLIIRHIMERSKPGRNTYGKVLEGLGSRAFQLGCALAEINRLNARIAELEGWKEP